MARIRCGNLALFGWSLAHGDALIASDSVPDCIGLNAVSGLAPVLHKSLTVVNSLRQRGPRIQFPGQPILISPYACPSHPRESDHEGRPATTLLDRCRDVSFSTSIPQATERKPLQSVRAFEQEAKGPDSEGRQYGLAGFADEERHSVHAWSSLPCTWGRSRTPASRHLRKQSRTHWLFAVHPSFPQAEAVRTANWRDESPLRLAFEDRTVLDPLDATIYQVNSGLSRLTLKVGTGVGRIRDIAMGPGSLEPEIETRWLLDDDGTKAPTTDQSR